MKYNVIDIDPAQDYALGEEVIGTVDAISADEAISKVLKANRVWSAAGCCALGVDVLKAYGPDEYAAHILQHVKAVPKQAGG